MTQPNVTKSTRPGGDQEAQAAPPDSRGFLVRWGIPNRSRLLHLGELAAELVQRDLKLRYKRTVLGIAWSLVSPLSQWIVLGFVFGKVLDIGIERYLSFLFTGILAWSWFQAALTSCATCVVDNASLLRRPGFPALILPFVAVATQFVHLLFSLPILFAAATLDGDPISLALVALPLVMTLQFAFTLGIGYLLSTLHVVYRDTRHLLEVALMLLFYLTPVFYDGAFVPPPFDRIYRLNPMLHLLEAYREVIVHGRFPTLSSLAYPAAAALILFVLGYRRFRRARHGFVEEM